MAGTAAGAAKARATRAGAATPTDRKPPARKAVMRKPTAAELGEPSAAQVETLGEDAANEDGSLDFVFEGETFRVLSPADWRQSAMAAMREGNFNGWAAGALDATSAARFVELDLTNRQASDFLIGFDEAYRAAFGDDPKESPRRPVSSVSTRRS